MLPKILTGKDWDKKSFFEEERLNENFTLQIDGANTSINELREWILFCKNVVGDDGQYIMLIWNAGKLSKECQSILLKPLEEKYENVRMFLFADKESDILPTILSRCLVVAKNESIFEEMYWKSVRKCWQLGPCEIFSFSESFDTDKLEYLLSEIARKLKNELLLGITRKRILVIIEALESMRKIYKTNVNKKMALESFLLSTWSLITSSQ